MTVKTPLGRVLRDENGMRLEFVRSFDAAAEDVWSALTEPDCVVRWIGIVSGDPTAGTVTLRMTEDEGSCPQTVTIVECEPPTRLVVELSSPDGAWHLTVVLRSQGDVTTLLFTHRLAEPHDARSIGPGWHYYLDRLDAVVTGQAVPDDWEQYYPSLSDDYALPS